MLAAGRSATDVARLFRVTRATISRVVSSVAQADVLSPPVRPPYIPICGHFGVDRLTGPN